MTEGVYKEVKISAEGEIDKPTAERLRRDLGPERK